MRQRLIRLLTALMLVGCGFHAAALSQAPQTWLSESTVGMPERIEDLVLPGSLLQVRPMADRNQSLVLRVVEVYPHGTDHRYELEYYALEPGEYNLADYLQRADGSAAGELPAVAVRVASTLPGGQIAPSAPGDVQIGWIGGYRWALGLAAVAWIAGLGLLLLLGRRRKQARAIVPEVQESLTDRLRRLLADARDRKLTRERGAELERSVIAFWREELQLEQTSSSELIQAIRRDEEAAAMLDDLGRLLHQPGRDDEIDLNELLKPIDRRLQARAPIAGLAATIEPGSQSGEVTAK